jgi:IclR family acetate operon transcriptional repressor
LTDNSISSESAFREHLKQIREYGYSIDDEEEGFGVRCVGTPIFRDNQQIFGAISISTLKGNLPMQKVAEYGDKLMGTAKILSDFLGSKT